MSLVRLVNITKRYEERTILRSVSIRLERGERVGLIGKNGSGKTSIIRMILGQEQPTEGTVSVDSDVKLGYFSQFSELDGNQSIDQVLLALFASIREIEAELEQIGVSLETVADDRQMTLLLDRQAHLFDEMQRLGGWDYSREIDTVLSKLGFDQTQREIPVDQLSGGWRNRASLAKLLLEMPDVLLLDEPTNFLDVEGLAWLESWLNSFTGAVLLVSHDRQFIDSVVTRIVEIDNHHAHQYDGNYTHYVRTKPLRMKNLERQFEHEEELLIIESESIGEREELKRDPSDSLRRKLADIKKRQAPRPSDLIVTNIYQNLRVPERLCLVEGISKSYGDTQIVDTLSFELARGERLGIAGPNGIGKSTLLRLLSGEEIADTGKITWERGASVADFNAIQRDLDLKDTVTHAVNTFGLGLNAEKRHVHSFLSLLQFSEADLKMKIGHLSGGQRARVALAKCLLSGAAVLLLDEPTNHLDIASTQVMEQALIYFPGGIVVVSHDRFFLDKVATRLLVFSRDSKPYEFNGNWTMLNGQG